MAMAALPAGLKADVGTTCDRCKIADWVAGSRPIPLAVLRHLVSAFKPEVGNSRQNKRVFSTENLAVHRSTFCSFSRSVRVWLAAEQAFGRVVAPAVGVADVA